MRAKYINRKKRIIQSEQFHTHTVCMLIKKTVIVQAYSIGTNRTNMSLCPFLLKSNEKIDWFASFVH